MNHQTLNAAPSTFRKRSAFEESVFSECAAYYGSVFPRIYNLVRVETEDGPHFDYTLNF